LKVELLWIGKSVGNYVIEGVKEFEKRIKHYHSFSIKEIPHLKNSDKLKPHEIKKKEAELLLSKVSNDDFIILLDENGKLKNSIEFADFLQQKMLQSVKKLVFIIGGAYGFDTSIYSRANQKLSLSPMTFSHQLIRVIFLEQLYRANTIIRKEPYHNV
jgi:23S rRNA (pseudouridine1915-N3)-methyltransferase